MSTGPNDSAGFGVAQPIDFIPAPTWQDAPQPPYPQQPPQQPMGYLPGQPPVQPPIQQPVQPPTQRPKRRRRLPVIIVSTVLAVALVIVAVPWIIRQTPLGRTPVSVVEEYLTALAAGRISQALELGQAQPTDTTFLTDAVLAQSLADNPIVDIDVPDSQTITGNQGEIEANYVLGGLEVNASIAVSKVNGIWMLDSAFSTLDLTTTTTKVTLTLSGIDTTGKDTIDLLPGIYPLATTNPMLAVGNGSVVVRSPGAEVRLDTTLRLSDEGAEKIRQATGEALNSCLAATTLTPTGCGFDYDRFYAPVADESTISRHLAPGYGDLSSMAIWLDYGSTTKASGSPNLIIQFEFTSKTGRAYRLINFIYDVAADFTDPNNITITFN